MRHLWSILAERVITSQETKLISLISVIESVTFDITPDPSNLAKGQILGIPVMFSLVSTWTRDEPLNPEQGHCRIVVRSPQGKTIRGAKSKEYTVDLTKTVNYRITTTFEGFPYVGNGLYGIAVQYQINSKWKDATIVPLQVIGRTPKEKDRQP